MDGMKRGVEEEGSPEKPPETVIFWHYVRVTGLQPPVPIPCPIWTK